MGRKRTANKHLPRRMVAKHGAFYYVVPDGKYENGRPRYRWTMLDRDYAVALQRWSEIEGRTANQARTITDLLASYIAAMGTRLKPETLRGYSNSKLRLARVFGHMRPEDLRREHVYRYLVEAGNTAANRDRALLGAAYTHAKNLGYDGANPAHGLNYRNAERPRQRYVTDDELLRLVAAAPPAFGTLIRFAYLTGMREGDICALRLTSAGDEGIRVEQGKTGKVVLIAWSDELRALWKSAASSRIGAQPLFRTRTGDAYTTGGMRAVWRKVKLAAGLGDVRFHDLRRKAGSDVAEDHAHRLLGNTPDVARKHYRARLSAVKPVR